MSNSDIDFDRLFQRYADDQASPEEMRLLNEHLRTDAKGRRRLMALLNLDSALAEITAGGIADSTPAVVESDSVDSHPGFRRRQLMTATAGWMISTVVCIGLLGYWWQSAAAPSEFARVERATGVAELSAGQTLRDQQWRMRAGTLELVTSQGARIVLEAPAEFQFESRQRLQLKAGRLSAEVPPAARGFTVITPDGRAVDLGTRFGVDVPASGPSEIHVFEGEVIAQSADSSSQTSLKDGEAYQLQSGAGASRDLRSAAFIRADEVASLHAALAAGQRGASHRALEELRQDPALIALLDFEGTNPGEGKYRMVQGRWPGSQAPEFAHVGDHLLVAAGADRDWPQLTLAAWVRIDRLNAPYQSLLHTDGWSAANPGQVHWMINRNTTMRLALFGNTLAAGSDEQDGYPDSRSPVLPEQGRWVHLAAVYDAGQKTVRFYLNGQFDKQTNLDVAHPARLGPAQIGNWERQDRKLSGRIDEMLLLGRAMTDREVGVLFEAGSPYR